VPIEQISLEPGLPVAELWREAAEKTCAWLHGQGLNPRDAVVLLPFAALMSPARAAWSAIGGWQPRIETTLTLASSLGPPETVAAGTCCGDPTQDAMTASLMLRKLTWGAEWSARDPAGFARIVDSVVDATKTLRDAALARAPAARDAFWSQLRAAMPPAHGPAAIETALLQAAVEWAAISATATTDRLYAHRPTAWIVVRLGGTVPAAEGLLGHANIPSLLLQADPPSDAPFDAVAMHAEVQRVLCDDFESEAQAAAAEIFDALNAGRTPVALVALDRELVRRVRALLEREHVPLVDETGWLLATTRPAAAIVALLRAARTGASDDALLEWLKTWPPAKAGALESLEGLLRGRRFVRDEAAANALKIAARNFLQPFSQVQAQIQGQTQTPTLTLAEWLVLLRERLEVAGSFDALLQDYAGEQVLAALGLPLAASWQPLAHGLRLDLSGFTAWVERTLEGLPFLPLPDEGAQLVLTPLTRSFGRPFAQVVIPGADHVRLGAIEPTPSLISESWAAAVGLDTSAVRHDRQRLALAQVLRASRVSLLRRRRDDDEPLAESPDVEWLLLARQRAGGRPEWPQRAWVPALREIAAQPVQRPEPAAAQVLPVSLSASRLEALRDCPYRFYSRAVLRLDEAEEINTEIGKRDYGTWLHAVLHRFHSQREPLVPDGVALMAAADAVTKEQEIETSDLLPFRASFDTFAPAYLAWLFEREAAGWNWREGEATHEMPLPDWPELTLRGVIDRIDTGPARAMQLLDYKTSSTDMLKRRVSNPLEDTQLTFYAALLGAAPGLSAAYVSLDDAKAPATVEHEHVHEAAQTMMAALAGEWQRLKDGAALPALGEGSVCETCEARGLCRRDHWTAQ
jgi:ATP-dependent helicase/nuclease subunit B